MWCPVYKAASTSWIKNLYWLIGLDRKNITALNNKFPGFVTELTREEIFSTCILVDSLTDS